MNRHSILFVDDEAAILHSLQRVFRKEPYEVLSAGSGQEALAVLAGRPVSLIVSDLGMPDMNGFQLLSLIKERYPEIVRIILTGYADTNTAIRAINEGEVYRFFTKPWNNDELRVSVRETLCHFDLVREASRVVAKLRRQDRLLHELEQEYPGITRGAAEDVFVIPEDLLATSAEEFLGTLETDND